MTHAHDSGWGASIPLSILPHAIISPPKKASVSAVDRSSAQLVSLPASSAFTERDYIGLNSSAPCANHAPVAASMASLNHGSLAASASPALQLQQGEDTELRLGFGPSRELASGRDQLGNVGTHDGSRTSGDSCNGSKICPAMTCGEEKPQPQQQQFSGNPGQESLQGRWKSEQLQLPAAANAADKSFQDRNGDDPPVREAIHVAKETPWSLSPLSQPNHLLRHQLNSHALALKPINGNLELKFAPRDAPAPTERGAFDASAAQFWPTQMPRSAEGFRAPSCQDEAVLAPGRFVIPVPKVSTVPAKRPYFEALNDSRSNYASEIRNDPRVNVSAMAGSCGLGDGELKFPALQAPPGHAASGLFSWNNVIQIPTGWSIMGMEQSKALFASMPAASSSQGPPQFKAPTVGVARLINEPAKESLAKAPSLPGKQANIEAQNEDGGSRAPVVGWPPIRSFRKNTLAAQPKPNVEDLDHQAGAEASDQSKLASSSNLFVKAKLDGVRIGRKVNLKSYDSYDSLKLALQDMFRGFVNGGSSSCGKSENTELDLLHSTDYVLTHEDNDGDCMLAGDVPWEMFVTTVKSLRIMKGSEAAGLGQRASKLKMQAKMEGKECGMERITKVEK